MSPVTSRRIICRNGDAGVAQSAFLAGLLAIILVIILAFVVLAPIVGGAAANYWLCQLFNQNPASCADPATQTALPPVVPGDIPKPGEDCIVIPGPISQFPVCTTEDGDVVLEVDMGDTPDWVIKPIADEVNETGSLGNYVDQIQTDFPLEGIPPIPTDLEGHVEITDGGIKIIVPNDEVHEEKWWISAWVASLSGIALGWLAEAACQAAMTPVPPPVGAALVVCGAVRGFVTGFMGAMIYQLMEGNKMSDPAVWGRSLVAGLIGATGGAAWEGGANKFMRNTLSSWIRNSAIWIGQTLKKFGSWIGDNVLTPLINGAQSFVTAIADGWAGWWDEALANTPRPPGANAATRPGGTGHTIGGEPLIEAYLRVDGARPSQTRMASERDRTPSLV